MPKRIPMVLIILMAFCASSVVAQPTTDSLTIDTDQPGITVSLWLYGIFFEEINRAGDGGIYAEMIQDRSFESTQSLVSWKALDADIAQDTSVPLNDHNPTSLRVTTTMPGGGVANGGFARGWSRRNDPGRIAVKQGKSYDLSLYARSEKPLILNVALQSANRKTLASARIEVKSTDWQKHAVTLVPTDSDAYSRLVITADRPATFWLDMVSLFPQDTWKGRKNGLRADLMDMLDNMKPAFLRFPGGCFVEGIGVENRVQWKQTIGDIAQRPGHENKNWGYRSTDGLGYFEYLQMAEDLGAEPVFVINCGMGHDPNSPGQYAVPMDQMGPFVQDALDAIEYANGPVTSRWGALRAKAGHPEPFNLKMIEIGNENSGPAYNERYALFHDAIKARYPHMLLISDVPLPNRTPDMVDLHHYGDFNSFIHQVTRFDDYDRNAPKIYFGEYAQTFGAGRGSLQAAIGEAAFMTGLERNSDAVEMASYAPLLCNPDWQAWNPNAIVFDQRWAYGTPSYWVQAMFAANRPDRILPTELYVDPAAGQPIVGMIGLGTWDGQAEFKDIKVSHNGLTLLKSDFSKNTDGWRFVRGDWSVKDGALQQTSDAKSSLALAGEPDWHDYTLTLMARKISGAEGFLITFGVANDGEKSWWNLGGWGNVGYGVESTGLVCPHVPGRIETDRWYQIKIIVHGSKARFYLDGKLIHDLQRTPRQLFTTVAGRDEQTGETILKCVNAGPETRTLNIRLRGAKPGPIAGRTWVLTSAHPDDENSFDFPTRITPQEQSFSADAPSFTQTFPPYSVTILRWK